MNTPSATPQRTNPFNTMRAKGLGLCALGCAMLSVPLFAGESPVLMAYAGALRPAGWFALAAGAVLLGLHHIARAKRAKAQPHPISQPQPAPEAPEPGGQATLREIRDELKRKADSKT